MVTKSRVLNIILGSVLLGPAIALILCSNIGLDPLGCLVDSLSQLTYNAKSESVFISYGTMLTCVNICFLTFHFIRHKDIKFVLFGLLMSIGLGGLIDLCALATPYLPSALGFRIIWFILGFILMCFGIAFIQKGKIQKMPFEGFQESISKIVKKDINVVRVYVEIALFILALCFYAITLFIVQRGFVLWNTVNVGTIFVMLLTGPTVNLIYKKIIRGDVEDEQQVN